jgi:hypothetical protein
MELQPFLVLGLLLLRAFERRRRRMDKRMHRWTDQLARFERELFEDSWDGD